MTSIHPNQLGLNPISCPASCLHPYSWLGVAGGKPHIVLIALSLSLCLPTSEKPLVQPGNYPACIWFGLLPPILENCFTLPSSSFSILAIILLPRSFRKWKLSEDDFHRFPPPQLTAWLIPVSARKCHLLSCWPTHASVLGHPPTTYALDLIPSFLWRMSVNLKISLYFPRINFLFLLDHSYKHPNIDF